jgi:hypothetical protein
MTESKFKAVFDQRKKGKSKTTKEAKEIKPLTGRPRGKSSNPNYTQITAYIPKELHNKVKIALIQEGRKEFSQLIEDQLTEWVSRR